MKDLTKDAIAELTSAALEKMAFMLLDVVDELEVSEGEGPYHHASIQYEIECECSDIYLSASSGFITELASAMLGIDEEEVIATDEGAQALCELANILAGEVGRILGAEHAPFHPGLPHRIPELPTAGQSSADIVCCFDSMGEGLRVLLRRRSKACA